MKEHIKEELLRVSRGTHISRIEKIQSLWNGYGDLLRVSIPEGNPSSLIVKHIHFASGASTDISHQRKLKSYKVEMHWYSKWEVYNRDRHYIPRCYRTIEKEEEGVLILEDLKDKGFPLVNRSIGKENVSACLQWLAAFHADYLGENPQGLWNEGTYWHLDTRPQEWKSLRDRRLREAAKPIDLVLKSARYKTLLHGDAKLANFCFSKDGKKAAAVDFQYIGGGCGMKDLVYFIGSCYYDEQCEKMEASLLDEYFFYLESALEQRQKGPRAIQDLSIPLLIREWRKLYPAAWADFHRFIKGWTGGSWDKNSYSEKICRKVMDEVLS